MFLFTLTTQTCGEACWSAREEHCRCSCGGKNHGCLKVDGGTQPVRMAKIDGHRYKLHAVGPVGAEDASKLLETLGDPRARFLYHRPKEPGSPVRLRAASASEIARWPELAAWRGRPAYERAPNLLWVREDVVVPG